MSFAAGIQKDWGSGDFSGDFSGAILPQLSGGSSGGPAALDAGLAVPEMPLLLSDVANGQRVPLYPDMLLPTGPEGGTGACWPKAALMGPAGQPALGSALNGCEFESALPMIADVGSGTDTEPCTRQMRRGARPMSACV